MLKKKAKQPKNHDNKEPVLDIWAEQARRGAKIERHEIKEYVLSGGEHYWAIDDARTRGVICLSCPIRHGGIIDAKEASETTIKKGIIYFRGKEITKKPKNFIFK